MRLATRTELADAFGVEDLDEVADDLYDDYLAYVDATERDGAEPADDAYAAAFARDERDAQLAAIDEQIWRYAR